MNKTLSCISQDLLKQIGQEANMSNNHPLKHNVALEVVAKIINEKGEDWATTHVAEIRRTILSVTSIL